MLYCWTCEAAQVLPSKCDVQKPTDNDDARQFKGNEGVFVSLNGRGRSAGGEQKQHAPPLTSQRYWECSSLTFSYITQTICCLACEHLSCNTVFVRDLVQRTHKWPHCLPDYNQFVQESKELKEFKDVVETLTGQNEQCDLDPLKLSHSQANLSVCVIDGGDAFECSADCSHLSFFPCLPFFPVHFKVVI